MNGLDELDAALARFRPANPAAVVDPAKRAAIEARTRYDRLSWWERRITRKPAGYRAQATGPVTR